MTSAFDLLEQEEIRFLPRNQIFPNPENDRKDWDSPERIEHVKSLAASFVTIVDGEPLGIIEPIRVRKIAHQHYEIISGESRWRATEIANIDPVKCVVTEKIENNRHSLEGLITNFLRNDLSLWELAGALQKRLDGDPARGVAPMSLDELSAAVSRSKPWISKYTAVLKMPEPIQALCIEGLVKNVDTLRDLAAYNEEDLQQAVNDIRSGANPKELVKEKPPKKEKEKNNNNSAPNNNNEQQAAQESDTFSVAINRTQAIQLLNRLGVYVVDPESLSALKEQLIAQITGV